MLQRKTDFEDHLAGTKDHAENDVLSTKRFKTKQLNLVEPLHLV